MVIGTVLTLVHRLDRLLLLLDTGSSSSVRNTAAKQLAQLAVKSLISDVAINDDDIKANRTQLSLVDASAWNELMAVVARVSPIILPHCQCIFTPPILDPSFPPLQII